MLAETKVSMDNFLAASEEYGSDEKGLHDQLDISMKSPYAFTAGQDSEEAERIFCEVISKALQEI